MWTNSGEIEWKRDADPADKDDYDPCRAFPSVKPRLDIFGIPPRTRKQRGWYQIRTSPAQSQSRFPVSCPEMLFPPAADDRIMHTPAATGANIPLELIDAILERMDDEDKRLLSSYSRVCRHWTRICQPMLFIDLKLRSH